MANNSLLDRLQDEPNFKPFMKKVALMGAVITLAGGLLRLTTCDAYGLLIVGFGMLAVVSFLLPRIFPQRDDSETEYALRTWWQLALRLSGWGFAMLLMGILFTILHWPGGRMLLVAGGGSVAISLLAWLWYLRRREKWKELDTDK